LILENFPKIVCGWTADLFRPSGSIETGKSTKDSSAFDALAERKISRRQRLPISGKLS